MTQQPIVYVDSTLLICRDTCVMNIADNINIAMCYAEKKHRQVTADQTLTLEVSTRYARFYIDSTGTTTYDPSPIRWNKYRFFYSI